MNVKELIKEFEEIGIHGLNMFGTVVKGIPTETAIDLIKQLDEPQPVKVPQFVADWIDYFKKTGDWDLFQAMDYLFEKKEIREWFEDKNNQEKFCLAWIFGYEVEEEKRYYVRFKWIEESYSYLTLIKHLHTWTLKNITLDKKFRTAHTRKELEEADFGWVFDCPGIEIEEVE